VSQINPAQQLPSYTFKMHFNSRQNQQRFLLSKTSTPAVGPTQHPVKLAMAFFPLSKQVEA
jgi:hypothetical protein